MGNVSLSGANQSDHMVLTTHSIYVRVEYKYLYRYAAWQVTSQPYLV